MFTGGKYGRVKAYVSPNHITELEWKLHKYVESDFTSDIYSILEF
jgi:hypothetical protein